MYIWDIRSRWDMVKLFGFDWTNYGYHGMGIDLLFDVNGSVISQSTEGTDDGGDGIRDDWFLSISLPCENYAYRSRIDPQ